MEFVGLPPNATNSCSLPLQILHSLQIPSISSCYDSPSQRRLNPLSDNLVSSLAAGAGPLTDLLLASQPRNPALRQPDADIDVVASQGCNHVSRAGGKWANFNVERESIFLRQLHGEMEGGQVVFFSHVSHRLTLIGVGRSTLPGT